MRDPLPLSLVPTADWCQQPTNLQLTLMLLVMPFMSGEGVAVHMVAVTVRARRFPAIPGPVECGGLRGLGAFTTLAWKKKKKVTLRSPSPPKKNRARPRVSGHETSPGMRCGWWAIPISVP